MAEKKYRFKGHESFILREGWINKGLREVAENQFLFQENYGADVLGVGPNMAKSLRYWMRCAKLLKEKGKDGVYLSELGEKLKEKDSYLEDVFSLWLLHCNIVKNQEQATAWNIFFNDYDEMEFTREGLEREMLKKVKGLEGIGEFSEKSVENDCEALLRMYVKKSDRESDPEEKNISPFGKFELLKQKGKYYWKNQPALHMLPAEIVWYLLGDCVSEENSVSIDDLLVMPESPGNILNLKRTGLVEKLEELEAKGYIAMNRTAGLDMVYLVEKKTGAEIVETYFEEKNKGKSER